MLMVTQHFHLSHVLNIVLDYHCAFLEVFNNFLWHYHVFVFTNIPKTCVWG